MKTVEDFSSQVRIVPAAIVVILILWVLAFNASAQEEFKPGGKIWGFAFGDFFYKVNSDSDQYLTFGSGEFAKKKKNDIAVTFRRIYLGYDYQISPGLSSSILLESNDAILTSGGKRTVFLKSLQLEWKKIIPRASIFIGQTATPTWLLISEPGWGYRSVEKTISDYRGLGGPTDLGIRITGKFDTAGVFGYTLMWGNGKGDAPETNNLKKVYGSLDARLLKKKLTVQLQADYEDNPAKYGGGYAGVQTFLGFISYQHDLFTLGIEGVYQIQQKGKINKVESATDTIQNLSPVGLSFWARGTLLKDHLYAFARFDNYTPDMNYTKGDNLKDPYDENFITAGLDFTPHKSWHLIPNIWMNTYQDKRTSSEAGYHERKADIVARITFHYIFK